MRWILWLLLACTLANGQERFQFFTTDNGLPYNAPLAVLQGSDGYLWFTTRKGLVRFDGVRFQVFDEGNTPAIQGSNFAAFSLFEDHHGAIWAGSWNGGALRYYKGAFRSFTTRDGLPNNRVVRIDEDEQGTIWLFGDSWLSRIRDGKVELVGSIDGELVAPYFTPPPSLAGETRAFGLWRAGRNHSGLQRFAYGKWSDVPLPPGQPVPAQVGIEVTLEDSRRRLWYRILDRPRESFCVQDGRLLVFNGLPEKSFPDYLDRFGRLWITGRDGHMALWQNGRVTPLSGISNSSALPILEDREGSFWLCTTNQGLAHAPLQVIRNILLPGGPGANNIYPILQDRQGDIWIGSDGLTRMHAGSFQTYFLPPSLAKWPSERIISSLWADPDGTMLLSTDIGLRRFRQGRFDLPDPPLQSIPAKVNAMIRDRSGTLWLGANGVYRYRDSKLTLVEAKEGDPLRGEIRTLAEDRKGTLWIGTDAGLCRVRNGALSCFCPNDELLYWRIRSITVDRDDVVWAGTASRGLLRIEDDRFQWIQAKDGLFANDTAGILEDAKGYLWIGSRLGIFRVQKQELDAFAHGRTGRVTSTYFGKADGLSATDCAGGGQPHGLVARDGTLWFPTAAGLAHIDPASLAFDNSAPRVQIESCTLEQQRVPCDRTISLPPEAENLEIAYTALNLVRSHQIQFRYRLEGLDKTWVEAGNRRTAYYSHLAPGSYRFLVTGANSFGHWSDDVKELSITVRPRYYQTLWFRCLAAASLIGAFVFMWRLRGIQYNKRQAMQRAFAQQILASQEAERKRIAGELHDSLGQHLTVIKNMALLLNRPDGHNRQHQLEGIANETTQAIAEVRNISRNLRPYQLDLLGLKKALEVLIARTCETSGIRADVVVDDLSGAFRKESEIHFYRIVQECLNNVAKHSKAGSVSVMVQRNAGGLLLVVSDDGVGFLPARANGDGIMGGFGLTGISERARLLGGRASFRSAPGHGTTVTIEIEPEAVESRKNGRNDA
jgi:signal transduction histidine kinase/ligand-binding sensor domain-containing protein